MSVRNIARCTRCVLPTALPSVKMDQNGVCNYCLEYERLFGNWTQIQERRKKEFEELVGKAKRLKRRYDCLIPLSGGKDSTYALYICSKVYGLKCLCITFDNGFLSQYAKENIDNAIKATNADHIFYTVDRNVLLRLYRLFLLKCGNFCPVCMRGIDLSMHMASQYFKIPIVVGGDARRIAYLGFIPELFEGGGWYFFNRVVENDEFQKDAAPLLMNPYGSNLRKIAHLTCSLLRIPTPMVGKHIGIFDYIDISLDEVCNILKKEMGWASPTEEIEHMDCVLHEIPFYIHTLKFPELTTTTCYHSGLIRLGIMTRERALDIEILGLTNRRTPKVLDSFLREIEISREEFEVSVRDWRKMDKFRNRKRRVIASLYHSIARD